MVTLQEGKFRDLSSTLTPLQHNTQRQGPGGQAYELAPTIALASHTDVPAARLKKFLTIIGLTFSATAVVAGVAWFSPRETARSSEWRDLASLCRIYAALVQDKPPYGTPH